MSVGSASRSRLTRPRLLIWLAAIVLSLAGALATFALLNATLYTAGSFVGRYLQAVASDDIATVMQTPGVRSKALPEVSQALLRPGVLDGGPRQVRIVADEANPDGTHTVTAEYRLGAESYSSRYELEPLPPMFGVINRWQFVESPLQVLTVSVANGSHFTAGSLTLDTRARQSGEALEAFSHSADYLAVAPAQLELFYDSELLVAEPVIVDVTSAGDNSAGLEVLPTPELVDRVQTELDEFLAACATQRVLQPSGCPFGAQINDRVTSEPVWSLVSNPVVTLAPGAVSFEMPPTPGVAHLTVEVQGLRDGASAVVDRDEEYSVALRVRVLDDQSIAIQLD